MHHVVTFTFEVFFHSRLEFLCRSLHSRLEFVYSFSEKENSYTFPAPFQRMVKLVTEHIIIG